MSLAVLSNEDMVPVHNTIIWEIFVYGNFHARKFRVEIFSWSGAATKIYYHEICSHTLRKWKIKKGILCLWLSRVLRHLRRVVKRTSLCQRDLWGCSDCMCFVFSFPLPGCPPPPPPALLATPKRLLELVLRTKVSLLGPVSRLYAAGTAIEPF